MISFMFIHNMNKVSLASVIIALKNPPKKQTFWIISWNVPWFKCLRKLGSHMAQIDLSLFFTVTQTLLPYHYPTICGSVNTSRLKVHGVIRHVLFIREPQTYCSLKSTANTHRHTLHVWSHNGECPHCSIPWSACLCLNTQICKVQNLNVKQINTADTSEAYSTVSFIPVPLTVDTKIHTWTRSLTASLSYSPTHTVNKLELHSLA